MGAFVDGPPSSCESALPCCKLVTSVAKSLLRIATYRCIYVHTRSCIFQKKNFFVYKMHVLTPNRTQTIKFLIKKHIQERTHIASNQRHLSIAVHSIRTINEKVGTFRSRSIGDNEPNFLTRIKLDHNYQSDVRFNTSGINSRFDEKERWSPFGKASIYPFMKKQRGHEQVFSAEQCNARRVRLCRAYIIKPYKD